MRATMLLADAAQTAEGKLYIIGGGWSVRSAEPFPSAIAIKIEVPWDQANMRHRLTLDLEDEDGRPVLVPGPDGEIAMHIEGEFEVGRPPGVRPGTPLDVPLAFTIGPFELPAGSRFAWVLTIDGATDDDWRLAFSTRAA